MNGITRRGCLSGSMAALAGAPLAAAANTTPRRETTQPGGPTIRLAELLEVDEAHKIRIFKQVGVNHAIASMEGPLSKAPRAEYPATVKRVRDLFQAQGMTVAGVESHPVPAEKIKLGLPGRDEEIENYIAAIRALGQNEIRMICYNFMAGLGWYRTKTNIPDRAGALISEFNARDAEALGLTQWGRVSEAQMWANIEYFLKAVIPVAQDAGVQMALHPDDPPISPLRGIARIVVSAANYRRIMNLVPSPVNGITFCQANFLLMGEDIAALVREWCAEKKIFFVHFRDVRGTKAQFRETFHDDGPTDLARMLEVYHQAGFDGPMRPDHAPTLDGEPNDHPGYEIAGKLFAFGYMKGAMNAFRIPYA